MKRGALLAEGLGAFLIVFFGCGVMGSWTDGATGSRVGVNLVFGLVVFVAVAALRGVSGAHLNPAVTFAAVLVDGFPKDRAWRYALAQCAGALLASALHALFLPAGHGWGETLPTIGYVRSTGLEALMTALLVFAAVRAGDDAKVGTAAGSVVALCGLFAGPLTGNSLNPARSLAPALFAGGPALAALPVYIIGPCFGAVAGGLLARRLLPVRSSGREASR